MITLLDIVDIALDEEECKPISFATTFLSSDLVVSPITKDGAGHKCLVITDLNFGELTDGLMH
jgi:hypothetical protein